MTSQLLVTHSRQFDSRLWAAEELALQLGWLCECPYHGEPFKSAAASFRPPQPVSESARTGCNGELYSLAAQLSSAYAEHCAFCALESAVPE